MNITVNKYTKYFSFFFNKQLCLSLVCFYFPFLIETIETNVLIVIRLFIIEFVFKKKFKKVINI